VNLMVAYARLSVQSFLQAGKGSGRGGGWGSVFGLRTVGARSRQP